MNVFYENYSKEKRNSMLIDSQNTALRGATDIIDVAIESLGISYEHLVRPISEVDVQTLTETDERRWEPIEIRVWPGNWNKPAPGVLYHVISGNHRTSAARIKGLATLRARLIEASDELSYTVAAISSNTTHGRNFTREEYIENAKKLHALNLPLGEIASVLGYSKSTVSRWITGSDSHASTKRAQENIVLTMSPPAIAPADGYGAIAGNDSARQKVMGLLMDAQIQADVIDAQQYLQTLKPLQQSTLRQLSTWLQEVLDNE
jgi:hypothetical protein